MSLDVPDDVHDVHDDDFVDLQPNERRSSASAKLHAVKWSLEEEIVAYWATLAANESSMSQKASARYALVAQFYRSIMLRFGALLWDADLLRTPAQPKTPDESIELRTGEAIEQRGRKVKARMMALVPQVRPHFKNGMIPSGMTPEDHWNASMQRFLATFEPGSKELKEAKLELKIFEWFCPQSPTPSRASEASNARQTVAHLSLIMEKTQVTPSDTLNRAQQRARAVEHRAHGVDPRTMEIVPSRTPTSPPPRSSVTTALLGSIEHSNVMMSLIASKCLGVPYDSVEAYSDSLKTFVSALRHPPAPTTAGSSALQLVELVEEVCEGDDVRVEVDARVECSNVAVEARADEEDHDRAAVEEHEPVVDVSRPVSPSDVPTQRASSPSPPPAKRARSIEEAPLPVRSSPRPHRAPTKLTT